jgi:hypothetical protein
MKQLIAACALALPFLAGQAFAQGSAHFFPRQAMSLEVMMLAWAPDHVSLQGLQRSRSQRSHETEAVSVAQSPHQPKTCCAAIGLPYGAAGPARRPEHAETAPRP